MAYQDNLQRYFGELARYGEPALTAGSSAIAEPISGLIGLGYTLAGQGNNAAVNAINKTQQAMTYQPRTAAGLQGLQGLQNFLQPVGDIVQGASQKLGDKAYSATGSPSLAAAAYSAPTALLEGLGLKGFNIARNPVSGADLYSARVSVGNVGNLDEISYKYKQSGVESSISERPSEIVLNKVIVPKESRGTGIGSDFMVDLTRYADNQGKVISLTPSADFGGSKARLTEFYKRFGFVENKGKNKDYEISEAMYRPKMNEQNRSD